jgi:hypothetical protein
MHFKPLRTEFFNKICQIETLEYGMQSDPRRIRRMRIAIPQQASLS